MENWGTLVMVIIGREIRRVVIGKGYGFTDCQTLDTQKGG